MWRLLMCRGVPLDGDYDAIMLNSYVGKYLYIWYGGA
jgi:hypothetical protein